MAPTYNLQHLTMDYPFMTLIVKVDTSSSGQKTVAKVLKDCHGILSFTMDGDGKVQVSGMIDPELLLKKLGKAGKKAEVLWLQFGECSNNLFVAPNVPRSILPSQDARRSSAYNQRHGYQIAHCKKNDYGHHAYDNYYQHQQAYDNRINSQSVYDHRPDCQQLYGSGYEVDHTHYRRNAVGEDIDCCRMM